MDFKIECITCSNKEGVCEQLNKWRDNGYKLSNYFVQIVPTKATTIEEFTIFYDNILDKK